MLPWESLRVAAGFAKEPGRYYIKRDNYPVPDDLKTELDLLKSRIFPGCEVAKENLKADIAGIFN